MKRDIIRDCQLSAEMAALARWENEGGSCVDCVRDWYQSQPGGSRIKRAPVDPVEVVSNGIGHAFKKMPAARELH